MPKREGSNGNSYEDAPCKDSDNVFDHDFVEVQAIKAKVTGKIIRQFKCSGCGEQRNDSEIPPEYWEEEEDEDEN